jgi:phage-related protein
MPQLRRTRAISWIKAAQKAFETFPVEAQDDILSALTVVADGGYPSSVKPLSGLGSGVFEVA